MLRSIAIAVYLTGATMLTAGIDESDAVSGAHSSLSQEFSYTPPVASDSSGNHEIVVTGPVVEMSPFRVEEMQPRHALELERKWAQRERLKTRAVVVKRIANVQAVAFGAPYLFEEPTPRSSNRAGSVMLTAPVLSLHW